MTQTAFNEMINVEIPEPEGIASCDLAAAAGYVGVCMEDDDRPLESMVDIMRKYPELVAAHAQVHAINRLELTYRMLKIEELRLLESIAVSLEKIAGAAESAKGKSNE